MPPPDGGGCDACTGDVTVERTASRDGRVEEVGVPDGKRRSEFEGSRGEAIVDIVAGVLERKRRQSW